jgi:TIR domain
VSSQSGASRSYVFLSYASADRDTAFQIAERLEARGIVVWLDRKSIAGGTSWTGEIVEGIKGCAALLVLISASALASPNVQQELQLAWEHRRPLVPLRLDLSPLPSTIEYVLAGRQWIDVLDLPEERWLAEALRALQGLNVGPLSTVPAAGSTPPSAAQTSPPPEAAPARHNLPVEVTSFVGRERELAEIRGLLASTHLLTLTGTGGCGKTRLALRLGESVLDDFADGVWLVELAPLSDPSLIPHFVATAVGWAFFVLAWSPKIRMISRERERCIPRACHSCARPATAGTCRTSSKALPLWPPGKPRPSSHWYSLGRPRSRGTLWALPFRPR